MFKGIDHIAIVVEDLNEAIILYEEKFLTRVTHREFIESDGVEVAAIDIGGTCIELVEGKTSDSPVRKFIDKKGPGIHHIAFEVDDIHSVMTTLKSVSIELIDKKPRKGKDGSLVAFLHPRSSQKILYELVQKRTK